MMWMRPRQAKILETLVGEYIKVAEPIGSEYLVRRYHLNISPATVRNDFSELTERGYLRKPHTSSGRIPTNKGYRFYVDALTENDENRSSDSRFKKTGKILSQHGITKDLADTLGLMAFSFSEEERLITAGSSKYLFSQPDFTSRIQFEKLAETLEELHFAVEKLFEEIRCGELRVFVGCENPYLSNDEISSIFAAGSFSGREQCLVGIIGPTRMPYARCLPLLKGIVNSK